MSDGVSCEGVSCEGVMSESDEEYQESESDALSDDEGNDGKKSYVITTSLLTQCLAFSGCVKCCTFNTYRHTHV